MYYGNYPATVIDYDKASRQAKVSIEGITDGLAGGLKAKIAYPVGLSDREIELNLAKNSDVWVFFEFGDVTKPVICYMACHSEGAITDTHRIKQALIELIATKDVVIDAAGNIKLTANKITLKAKSIEIDAIETKISGRLDVAGLVSATDVSTTTIASVNSHIHTDGSGISTTPPIPI